MRVKVLSPEQFTALTAHLQTSPPRIKAIHYLMLFCGLRNNEVCTLNWLDVSVGGFISPSLYIRAINSKSGVARHIDIPAPCSDALTLYYGWWLINYKEPDPQKPLFVTQNQKIRIQPKDVQRFVAATTLSALGTAFTPHALRHTYATRLLQYTNIRVVQMLLGHKSLASTEIYTHPTSADIKSAVDRSFPREVQQNDKH
jgi:site-specific recombinase XerD